MSTQVADMAPTPKQVGVSAGAMPVPRTRQLQPLSAIQSVSQPARQPRLSQPLDVLNVPGAQLKLTTLSAVAGRSLASIYRDEKAGLLKLNRHGARCTRVTSENARAYLALLANGAA
jgi:hypothetical protein